MGTPTANTGAPNSRASTRSIQKPPEATLIEGIASVLSRWYGLQIAVQNQWGGPDSLHKSHQLASHIFTLFSCSKGRVMLEDLENLLHESLILSFNTDMEDGSIEEIAEELMVMHEEYLHGAH